MKLCLKVFGQRMRDRRSPQRARVAGAVPGMSSVAQRVSSKDTECFKLCTRPADDETHEAEALEIQLDMALLVPDVVVRRLLCDLCGGY